MRIYALAIFVVSGLILTQSTLAAGGAVKSPTGTAPDRYVYPIIA